MIGFLFVVYVTMQVSAHPVESTFRNHVCHQCNSWCSTDQPAPDILPKIGKAGPRGPAGPRGSPGIVNMTAVEEMVDGKIKKAVGFLSIQSCRDIQSETAKSTRENGGVYDIYIPSKFGRTEVFCDVETDGGGWIVFQRRVDGSVDFYRNWDDYVNGFGNLNKEFWLGLEALHQLTKYGDQELRIDMIENGGTRYYAKYSSFKIEPSSDKYRLRVSGYSGNATDSFADPSDTQYGHVNQRFTTKDQDNDHYSTNCAVAFLGAWWYNRCLRSNLNGRYSTTWPAINWINQRTDNWLFMKFTEMKFRPKL